jgi:hypothetical protein
MLNVGDNMAENFKLTWVTRDYVCTLFAVLYAWR